MIRRHPNKMKNRSVKNFVIYHKPKSSNVPEYTDTLNKKKQTNERAWKSSSFKRWLNIVWENWNELLDQSGEPNEDSLSSISNFWFCHPPYHFQELRPKQGRVINFFHSSTTFSLLLLETSFRQWQQLKIAPVNVWVFRSTKPTKCIHEKCSAQRMKRW